MSKFVYDQIIDHIQKAQHILLLTDERIDGDTTGSTMGLYHVLTDLNKRVEVFSPKPLPASFKFLPNIDVIRRDPAIFLQPTLDLLIICDCSDGNYIKAFLPMLPQPLPLIVFDHHATNPMYGTVNLVEPQAASSADVAWRFVKAADWQVSPQAAQCFLTGICTDTVLFSTPNTTTAALDASSELVRLGADMKVVVKNTLMNQSLASLKLWGLAMERLFHDQDLQAVVTAVTQQDLATLEGTEDDVSGISGFLHAMLEGEHEVVLVYRETKDGHVKGSFRSRGRDVAKLAEERFGGGGHRLAAGFKIDNARLVEKEGKWVVEKTH